MTEYGLRRTASESWPPPRSPRSPAAADQSRDGVFLHVLTHVDPDHGVLVVNKNSASAREELGFPNASRSEKNKRTERTIRVLQTSAGTADCVGNGFDRFILPTTR